VIVIAETPDINNRSDSQLFVGSQLLPSRIRHLDNLTVS